MIMLKEHLGRIVKVTNLSTETKNANYTINYHLGDIGVIVGTSIYPEVKRKDGTTFLAVWSELELVNTKKPLTNSLLLSTSILLASKLRMHYEFTCTPRDYDEIWHKFMKDHDISHSCAVWKVAYYDGIKNTCFVAIRS